MTIDRAGSVCASARYDGTTISVDNKLHASYPHGVNKPAEYSWFYLLRLRGKPGEKIRVRANVPVAFTPTRNNSLVFCSTDGWRWRQHPGPVHTDASGLAQQYTFTFPHTNPLLLANTMFFDYQAAVRHLIDYARQHDDRCRLITIGESLHAHPLYLLQFPAAGRVRGRILLTTGCHPAEPDLLASMDILEYLASPQSAALRRHYHIDVMPMQNPDGYAEKSCLTANGINLYWNFRKDDRQDCPEAYFLWQYLLQHPPLLYLDFHAYVHQYHRHPQPYLQPLTEYRSRTVKQLVRTLDRQLVKLSQGNFHYGSLTAWPDALSTQLTRRFNTIAYTKYHLNLHEGVPRSRQRARDIFRTLTASLLDGRITAAKVLVPPAGTVLPDKTDTPAARRRYQAQHLYRTSVSLSRAYARYYWHKYAPMLTFFP
ncbi:MAG: hypothetical protein COT71_01750 [Candidatus Andersenbacteria bacterium CG10_big_fil_rev_8_21_14_0_10_54_11]|uniref:Peptidase M14 domain-containing protein n=1 Tax=Candidatus Andersenbacteria bacterium CG10_big_fil_rev_8_21_14_0_10_54_11 TaxID=1974485 RepID=A0A2M6WZQ3_9BACT|nr:MAG: hypothetical protein COT71_01750 [Candidatus Andersenbacteria bacterium CG10_big_fil_rev_8_21_14_0_10_54_11]